MVAEHAAMSLYKLDAILVLDVSSLEEIREETLNEKPRGLVRHVFDF